MIFDKTPGVHDFFSNENVTGYVGFDPTSKSLHVGNLLPIMNLVRLQKYGHTPIALVGGGTGLIGDPSGKSEERKILTDLEIEENLLKDNFSQKESASNVYNDDIALYSLQRLQQHRSWKTCYLKKSRKIHFKTGNKRTGVKRTSLWEMWNTEHGKLAGIHCQLLDEFFCF